MTTYPDKAAPSRLDLDEGARPSDDHPPHKSGGPQGPRGPRGPRGHRFLPWALATTIATYLLIAVGALVRAAGAGLGCPDWPKCFGLWIPPLRAADLPPGFDPSAFNAAHTWLEYVNRLLGVSIGILIFITLILAWRHYRRVARVIWPVTAAFVFVGIEGYLGGQVVRHGLDPDILTAHMLLAVLIVSLLLYAYLEARFVYRPGRLPNPAMSVAQVSAAEVSAAEVSAAEVSAAEVPAVQRRLALAGLALGVLVLIQVAVGTRVRGLLQGLEKTELARHEWLPLAGYWPDLFHRQLSIAICLACAALWWVTRRRVPGHGPLGRSALAIGALSGAQIAVGLGLAYLAVPPPLQVIHLALASLMVGAVSVYVFQAARVPPSAP